MHPRTLELQNQIRSTASGVEYVDTMDLTFAETVVNESFLNDTAQVSGTLVMDMNFLRTAVRDIKGEAGLYNWFDPAGTTPGLVTLSGARETLSNIQTFIGADSDSDTTPDYTSTIFITQNTDLETAISALDAALSTVSGSASGGVFKRILIRSTGNTDADTTIDLSTPDTGWTVYGDTVTWTSASDFVENVSVFLNGQLQLPASGVGDGNDVYHVATPDSMAFSFKISKNDIVQVWKTPSAP